MKMTANQTNFLADIKSGIKHLTVEFPSKKKFKLKEVLAASGHEDGQVKLYQMIKSLVKRGNFDVLNEMHRLFSSVSIEVLPLQKALNKDDSELIKSKESDDEIEEIDQAEQTTTAQIDIKEEEDEQVCISRSDILEPKPDAYRVNEYDRINLPRYDEISCLSAILRLLSNFNQQKRSSILASAESFFQIGM